MASDSPARGWDDRNAAGRGHSAQEATVGHTGVASLSNSASID